MRTMLIPLILICSLTQFESVQADLKNRFEHPTCGKIFFCFAPEICTGDVSIENDKWSDHSLVEVKHDTKVTDDCPAFFRYHINAKYSYYISIESFQDAETINYIDFAVTYDLGSSVRYDRHKFSCELKNDKFIGKHEIRTEVTAKNFIRELMNDDRKEKLKCVFEVRAESRLDDILGTIQGDDVEIFKINTELTKGLQKDLPKFPTDFTCNPEDMEFYKVDKVNANELYDKIQYEPGKLGCKSFYKAEYRPLSAKEYMKDHTLSCPKSQYLYGPVAAPKGAAVDVRCTADVKYFCNYNVSAPPGELAPILKSPVWNDEKQEETKLECPDDKPILNIVRENAEKSFLKPYTIKCVNYGSKQFWVVNDVYKLTEKGRPVYCSATVKCERQFKMTYSQVKNGLIDHVTHLPVCTAGGELRVGDKEVLDKGCNEKTGQFFYTVEAGQPVSIDAATQFACKFQPADNVQKDKDDEQFIWSGVIVASAVALLMAAALAVGLYIGVRVARRRKFLRQKVVDDAIFDRFCVGKEEKKRLVQAFLKKKQGEASKKEDEQQPKDDGNKLLKLVSRKKSSSKEETPPAAVKEGTAGVLPSTPVPESKRNNKWSAFVIDRALQANAVHQVKIAEPLPFVRAPIADLNATAQKNRRILVINKAFQAKETEGFLHCQRHVPPSFAAYKAEVWVTRVRVMKHVAKLAKKK